MNLPADAPVLVTGAAGLIGHAVAMRLLARGTAVIPVDRRGGLIDGLEVIECDIGDIHRLHALARGGLDAVIHCGAFSGPMVARDAPHAMFQVNIAGTANVLELARVHAARRFVYVSSNTIYGAAGPGPILESALPIPSDMYGASKASSELLAVAYDRQYGLSSVSIRLCWVYGPRRTTDCVIRTMVRDAQAGRPTHLGFGADFHRQFIHVDDAADALIAALDADTIPQAVYNASGGTNVTIGDVADLVRAIIPSADIQVDPGPDPVDNDLGQVSIEAIRRDLGWAPRIPLPAGIEAFALTSPA
ncbi:MAG: NAD-dependent dehydratase [Pseudonocardiales bacterium]|nr:NAD-dependent dehydratase [Pseudonocardiales bacterium]